MPSKESFVAGFVAGYRASHEGVSAGELPSQDVIDAAWEAFAKKTAPKMQPEESSKQDHQDLPASGSGSSAVASESTPSAAGAVRMPEIAKLARAEISSTESPSAAASGTTSSSNKCMEDVISKLNDLVLKEAGFPAGSRVLGLDDVPADFHRGGSDSGGPARWDSSTNDHATLVRFSKVIQREVGMLREHLPNGTFVHTFAQDAGLMRFVIVGPAATPYAHVLHPPVVHYRSFIDDRAHPNLYESSSGKVCLSLLGTWPGGAEAPAESWQPGQSTLLQVIVSLHGLILGSKLPYFSEPGLEEQQSSEMHGK